MLRPIIVSVVALLCWCHCTIPNDIDSRVTDTSSVADLELAHTDAAAVDAVQAEVFEDYEERVLACPMHVPEHLQYCGEGDPNYPQRIRTNDGCPFFEPLTDAPQLCTYGPPFPEFDFAVDASAAVPHLGVRCSLDQGCPEIVASAAVRVSIDETLLRLTASAPTISASGAFILPVTFRFSRGDEQDRLTYSWETAIGVTSELDLAFDWGRTVRRVWTLPGTDDVLLIGSAESSPATHPYPESWSEDSRVVTGQLTRVGFDGTVRWSNVSGAQYEWLSPGIIRDGMLPWVIERPVDPACGLTSGSRTVVTQIDLESGQAHGCASVPVANLQSTGPVWLDDFPLFWNHDRHNLGHVSILDLETAALAPLDVPLARLSQLDYAIRLPDASHLVLGNEWLHFAPDLELLGRMDPLGTGQSTTRPVTFPLIGYNGVSMFAGAAGIATFVTTESLFSDSLDVLARHDGADNYAWGGLNAALQDGTWLVAGSPVSLLLDGAGNTLWEIGDPEVFEIQDQPSSHRGVIAVPYDEEHLLIISNPSASQETGRDVVYLYLLRHVHGGVANTVHAMRGYDIHRSSVPPANPVVGGPEIEPRWTLAE